MSAVRRPADDVTVRDVPEPQPDPGQAPMEVDPAGIYRTELHRE